MSLPSKGYRQLTIKGIEGRVNFRLERYKTGGDFFNLTEQFKQGLESKRLKEWIKLELPHKSYHAISSSLEVLSGESLYSSNHLSEKAKVYAQEVTQATIDKYAGMQLCIPFAKSEVAIYEEKSKEILLFDDAIGVRRQKEKREKNYKKTAKTVQTDVIEVQKPNGNFEYITAGFGVKHWDIATALLCCICFHYGQQPLPIVAITDGASTIRNRLYSIFGGQVVIILDWYHLHKKMKELLSMIAWNKNQKEQYLKHLMPLLWEGKTDECIVYLYSLTPRNIDKWQELIDYLTKHKKEIINYQSRKEIKKTIGSGRAEKGVDLVVAMRQKNKPIAWSEKGSNALSVLKADMLNSKIAA
jgi:hypothetical protein